MPFQKIGINIISSGWKGLVMSNRKHPFHLYLELFQELGPNLNTVKGGLWLLYRKFVRVLGTMCQTMDEDQIYVSHKSQYHTVQGPG